MKRTIGTLGAVGLAALVVAAPAVADRGWSDDAKIIICHAGSGSNAKHYTVNSVPVPSLNGHGHHGNDIIPPNDGLKYGKNWDAAGQAIYNNGCAAAPPVDNPPVDNPPVDNPPVDNPPVDNPPVDNPPVDNPPVDNPPVVNPPVNNPPAVVPPAVTPVVPPAAAPAVAPPAAVTPVVPAQPAATQVQQATGAVAAAPVSMGTNQGYNAQTAVGGNPASPAWLGGIGALVAAGAAVAIRRRSASSPTAP